MLVPFIVIIPGMIAAVTVSEYVKDKQVLLDVYRSFRRPTTAGADTHEDPVPETPLPDATPSE